MPFPFIIATPTLHILYNLWFFSNLVVESLIDFQRKVAQIMVPIGFAFDNFNFIVYPFQLSSMDGIFTMI